MVPVTTDPCLYVQGQGHRMENLFPVHNFHFILRNYNIETAIERTVQCVAEATWVLKLILQAKTTNPKVYVRMQCFSLSFQQTFQIL